MNAEAYPLSWPIGWQRTAPSFRKRAQFGKVEQRPASGGGFYSPKGQLSVYDGVARVLNELRMMGVPDYDVIVSSNAPLRRDGLPRSDTNPTDPGAAVYWRTEKGRSQVMAIDLYDRLADNLGAIAATLNAMRAIERHGGAQILERAFTGFTALPAPGQTLRSWREVLGFEPGAPDPSLEQLEARYRVMRSAHHPDRGGSSEGFQAVQTAYEQARQAIGGAR